jgi:hypothetical protein
MQQFRSSKGSALNVRLSNQHGQRCFAAPFHCYRPLAQGQPEYGAKKSRSRSRYSYRPLLHTRDTRVAVLEPADQFNDPIRLSLKRISLTGLRHTQYEALSYVWGSITGDCRVYCDGKLLYVTSNCESALRYLRLKKRSRVLWIDALCINQTSNAEKIRQIPMMGDIYESAARVLLWLGPGNKDIPAVFRRASLLHPFISSPLYALRSFGPRVGIRFGSGIYCIPSLIGSGISLVGAHKMML